MTTTLRTAILGLIVAISLSASTALAGTILYEDRTEFLNAAAGAGLTATNEDFGVNPGNPFTLDDGNGNALAFEINSGSHSAGELAGSLIRLSDAGFSGQVAGLGFDFFTDLNDGVFIGVDGSPFSHSQSGQVDGFLGVLWTDGTNLGPMFERIVVATDSSRVSLDNLVIITPGAAIPEPATLALLGLGLAGMGVIARRRRRR